MDNGWYELLYILAGLALLVGGIKLYMKESSRDGGLWRKLLGIVLVAFGVGTVYGVLSRIFGDVAFLDAHGLVRAIWDQAVIPVWGAIRDW